MRADQGAGLGVPDHLDEAVGSPAAVPWPARGTHAADLIGMFCAFALSSVRPTEAISDAVGAGGDRVVVDLGRVDAGDLLATNTPSADATCARPRPIHVADRPQAVAAAVFGVDLDEAAFERHVVGLEADVLGVGRHADGDEQDVGLERACLAAAAGLGGDRHAGAGGLADVSLWPTSSWKPCARMRASAPWRVGVLVGTSRGRNSTMVTSTPSER